MELQLEDDLQELGRSQGPRRRMEDWAFPCSLEMATFDAKVLARPRDEGRDPSYPWELEHDGVKVREDAKKLDKLRES